MEPEETIEEIETAMRGLSEAMAKLAKSIEACNRVVKALSEQEALKSKCYVEGAVWGTYKLDVAPEHFIAIAIELFEAVEYETEAILYSSDGTELRRVHVTELV